MGLLTKIHSHNRVRTSRQTHRPRVPDGTKYGFPSAERTLWGRSAQRGVPDAVPRHKTPQKSRYPAVRPDQTPEIPVPLHPSSHDGSGTQSLACRWKSGRSPQPSPLPALEMVAAFSTVSLVVFHPLGKTGSKADRPPASENPYGCPSHSINRASPHP